MKHVLIPLVLVLIQRVLLVAIARVDIALSPDPETEMVWLIFYFTDFPISRCIFASNFSSKLSSFALPILFLGTIPWGIIGFVIQGVLKWLCC